MDMGEKIKKLREAKGMTLEELGDKVGVGKSTVRKWEKGIIANMRRDKIAKVAKALNVSPSYLMGWEELEEEKEEEYYLDPCATKLAQEVYKRPELKVLFDASRHASKEDIEQVADLLKKLSDK